ncbi:MAG: type IV pilus modification PilV family protein [Cyanobacteriota bacterium]
MAAKTNWLYRRRHWQEQGFSLLEVLASVVIVAIAMASLAPALTLVAYRRAMSERVEVANQLAQAEVDRIRTLANLDQLEDYLDQLRVGADPLEATPAPASMNTDGSNYWIRLAEIQVPGRNPEKYVIQGFRSEGDECIDIPGLPCSFTLGVRVYHRFSFDPETLQALPGLQTTPVSANQNLANADVWLHPLATSLVEINLASSLSLENICREILARKQLSGNCEAFSEL